MNPLPLAELETPCLLIDEARMERNIARMRGGLAPSGVVLRPHLKTVKSLELARRLMSSPCGPATVSTLREAEVLADAGVTDMTYAVGIAPDKLARVQALLRRGVDLSVVLDSVEQARAVAARSEPEHPIAVLIEIDCDGHRSGVKPGDAPLLLEIARALGPRAVLRGVLTHAGESYGARGAQALAAAAGEERASVLRAAAILRSAGHPCPVVSLGSTPTALSAGCYEGVTEVRAGVFVFFDLVQAGIGVCTQEEIALSVLATVIGHQREKGWTIIDAGWTALSCDRGTASQAVDQGYGAVCDILGRLIPDMIVTGVNQEHGIVALRPGSSGHAPDLPIGTRLRILPSHACAMAEQHGHYYLAGADGGTVTAKWPRFKGW